MDRKTNDDRYRQAISFLAPALQLSLASVPREYCAMIKEIRIAADKPVAINLGKDSRFVQRDGRVTARPNGDSLICTRADMEESFRKMCGYSVHSYQNEIKNGFITLKGGHRVGLCASAVVSQNSLSGVHDISSMNLRIARQIKGAATPFIEQVYRDGICSVLIAGMPASGKTTLLRDLSRQLASGELFDYQRVCVIDERGEVGAVYYGCPQNDLGVTCDILDGYPKSEGIMIALRALSPDIIVCDEIGGEQDVLALQSGVNAGVTFIATIHADSMAQLKRRPQFEALIKTGAFQKIVFLKDRDSPCCIKQIIDAKELCGTGGCYAD